MGRGAHLVKQDLVLSELPLAQWPYWFVTHGVPVGRGSYIPSFDRTSMALYAAIPGRDIAPDSHRTAEGAVCRGELAPVFEDRKCMIVRMRNGTRSRSSRAGCATKSAGLAGRQRPCSRQLKRGS